MGQRLPPGHAAMRCKLRERELACLRIRISPARERERVIRPCDICPVGTNRARGLAAHARRQNAAAMEMGVSA
jgi:hypothetical protein